MKAATLLASCTAAALAAVASAATIPSSHPQQPQAQPQRQLSSSSNNQNRRVPTSRESAVLGRRILALTPLATLSTVFPADSTSDSDDNPPGAKENRPAGLGGMPHGLMDYIADCDSFSSSSPNTGSGGVGGKVGGNPTILAISVETSFKNAAAGSNMSVSVQWMPPHPPAKRIQSTISRSIFSKLRSWVWGSSDNHDSNKYEEEEETTMTMADPSTYSAANLPRFSLLGYVERIPGGDADAELARCFVKAHPDARFWLPGNRIHESHFVRLVVTQVYWIGGFGDRAFIGWIPLEEWQGVTKEEWEAVRLPGEKPGWKEWSFVEGAEHDL